MGKGYVPGKGTQEWKADKKDAQIERQRRQDNQRAWTKQVSRPSSSGGSACFASATPVLTPSGWRAIARIESGDLIFSLDRASGQLVERSVLRRDDHPDTLLWHLETEQDRRPVETTMRHRFMTERGWIQTRKLRAGDRLRYFDGSLVQVIAVRHTEKTASVHNLVTEGEHNYIAAGFVVHNYIDFYRTRAMFSRAIEALRSGGSKDPLSRETSFPGSLA